MLTTKAKAVAAQRAGGGAAAVAAGGDDKVPTQRRGPEKRGKAVPSRTPTTSHDKKPQGGAPHFGTPPTLGFHVMTSSRCPIDYHEIRLSVKTFF